MADPKKVVFVCTHNAGKSRLAEAYLRQISNGRFVAVSAGTEPSDSANPAAVEAAARAGIELRQGPGVPISQELVDGTELIVTFGCGVAGLASDAPVEDWDLRDPNGRPLKDYDDIRAEVARRVNDLAQRLGPPA